MMDVSATLLYQLAEQHYGFYRSLTLEQLTSLCSMF